jgi:hypothetical protein
VDPALLEVNGLSDMGVDIDLRRRHARAPIHEVAISWWKKSGEEFRAALQERSRSKVGRMARLKGEVETAAPLTVLPSPSLPKKVQATVDVMRKAGAPESDIEAFLLGQDTQQA